MRADAQLLGVAVRSVGRAQAGHVRWRHGCSCGGSGEATAYSATRDRFPTHSQCTCSPPGSAWHTTPAHLPWLLPLAACPAAAAAEAAAAPPAAYGEAHRRRRLCRAAAATAADAAVAVLPRHLSHPAGWRSRLGQPHCRQTAAAPPPGIGGKLPPPPAARRRCWARQIVARRRTTRMLLTPTRSPAAAGRAAGRGAVPAVGGGRDQALPRWSVAWRH